MSPRMRIAAAGLLIAVGVGVIGQWNPAESGDREEPVTALTKQQKLGVSGASDVPVEPRENRAEFVDEYPLVDGLLDPGSSPERDLAIVAMVLEAWQSNFPGQGNPVGENAEITASLAGRNRLKLDLIPANHPAINRQGELCDRWGTPLFFHQRSGTQMELRSAGPDREFYTADDVLWNPTSSR